MGSLEPQEKRISKFSTTTMEQALKSKLNISKNQESKASNSLEDYQRRGWQNNSRGRGKEKFYNQQRGPTNVNSGPSCFVFNKYGHKSKNCSYKYVIFLMYEHAS